MAIWILSGTTRVHQYQKGKTNSDFTETRNSKWQWHQLGHMQIYTSPQTDNHASTHHSVFIGRMPFLPPNQQRQSTEGNCLLPITLKNYIINIKTMQRSGDPAVTLAVC